MSGLSRGRRFRQSVVDYVQVLGRATALERSVSSRWGTVGPTRFMSTGPVGSSNIPPTGGLGWTEHGFRWKVCVLLTNLKSSRESVCVCLLLELIRLH